MTDKVSIKNRTSESQLQLVPRLQKELDTIKLMFILYCNDHHNTPKGQLCRKCSKVTQYARKRLSHCPFQANKPTCGKCTVHCYNKEMQSQVKEIMRYAGPKMIWHHPFIAIRHLWDSTKKPLTLPYPKKIVNVFTNDDRGHFSMKTLITGASGLVGNSLVEYLFQKGHSIQCLKRDVNPENKLFWATHSLPANTDSIFDTVIHLAGENVADGRWSKRKMKKILQSRIDGTRELVDYISLLSVKPKTFLCASATGYYGSRNDEILDENSSCGEGFLADVCKQWEKETQRLTTMNIRVVNLRFGMVLSPKGGALQKMIPPFKAKLGGIVGDGQQFISWISIRDLQKIINFIIHNQQIKGPVNIVSPIQTTNRELTKTLGKVLNCPTVFRIPGFLIKIIFGKMADEMLLASTRAYPQILLENGYTFTDQSLEAVLEFCTS